MGRIAAIAAAGLLLSAGSGRALTFFDLSTGDEGLLPDARSIALGRTRIVEGTGAFSGAANPAWLARTVDVGAALGGSVLKLKETRSTPAYDSFDGYLVESIYVLNDEYQFEGGAAVAAGYEIAGRRWGIGISRSPVRDFQYDYTEEVRDNNAFTQPRDALIAVNEIHSDGALDAWSFGVGGAALPVLDVGVTLQWLKGEQDFHAGTRWIRDDDEDFFRTDVSDLDGIRWLAGASWNPVPAVTTAAVFRSRTKVSGDFRQLESGVDGAVRGTVDVTYPMEITAGAAWRPRARMRTTVRFETTWVEWTEYENPLRTTTGIDDMWDARVGIEHVFYNGFPLRFGIRYAPSPLDDEVATTAFTFGAGLDVGPFRADLAFEVANRRYRYADLFDDAIFGGTSRTQKDLVEESGTSAFVTLATDWPILGD